MEASGTTAYLMAGVFILLGAVVVLIGFAKWRKIRVIESTPLSKIGDLSQGMAEIQGEASAPGNELLKSPFSRTECIYYKYKIEEYRRGSSSGSQSGGHSSSSWQEASSGEKGIPFSIKDETGEAQVNPENAEGHLRQRQAYYQESKGLLGGLQAFGQIIKALQDWDGKDPSGLFDLEAIDLQPLSERTGITRLREGDRRYYEYFILPGDHVFVMGTATQNPDAPNQMFIHKGGRGNTFIISDRKEQAVLKEVRKLMKVSFIIGSVFVAAGVVMLLQIIGVIPESGQ